MEIKGIIHEIEEIRQITEKFSVQNFKLNLTRFNPDTGEEYKNFAEFQNINSKVDLNNFKLGDRVNCHFNVSGRYFEKKDGNGQGFAQTLNCFKLEKI